VVEGDGGEQAADERNALVLRQLAEAGLGSSRRDVMTKLMTTPPSVVTRENERSCQQGFFLWS
jgi:hypothetical protein